MELIVLDLSLLGGAGDEDAPGAGDEDAPGVGGARQGRDSIPADGTLFGWDRRKRTNLMDEGML